MSESPTPEAKNENKDAAPKKSRKLLLIGIILAVLLAGGGAGFFYVRSAGASAEGEKDKKADAKKKKAADEEEDDAEDSTEEDAEEKADGEKTKKSEKKAPALELPDDSKVKHVVELQPFIVNLADQDQARYLRLSVSLGIGGEAGESKPDPLFTTRVRNAMLAVLTTKSSEDVLTTEGKAALRKELLRAARAASEEPRVEAVYITDFIVQL